MQYIILDSLLLLPDDATVMFTGSDNVTLSTLISNDLGVINDWFEAYGLQLNINKTYSIKFHFNQKIADSSTNFPLKLTLYCL